MIPRRGLAFWLGVDGGPARPEHPFDAWYYRRSEELALAEMRKIGGIIFKRGEKTMATWRLKSDWSQMCEVQSTGEAVVPPGLRYVRVPGCCPSKTASPVRFLVPYDFLALFWEPVPEPDPEVCRLVKKKKKNAKLAARNMRLRERNDLLRDQVSQLSATLDKVRSAAGGCGA